MSDGRYDISWDEKGPSIVQHFCREWDGDVGCYGTNHDHGYSFDEAKEEVARWYADQAIYWRGRTEAEEFPPLVMCDDIEGRNT